MLRALLAYGRFVDTPGETMSRPVRLFRNGLFVLCIGMALYGIGTLLL